MQNNYMEKPFMTEYEMLDTAARGANVAINCTYETMKVIDQMSKSINNTLIQLDKKKRRKQIKVVMTLNDNGLYHLMKHYDDGTIETVSLFINVSGLYKIYNVEFQRYSEDNGKYVFFFLI